MVQSLLKYCVQNHVLLNNLNFVIEGEFIYKFNIVRVKTEVTDTKLQIYIRNKTQLISLIQDKCNHGRDH